MGAEVCKKKKHSRRSRRVDHDSSSSESEEQSSERDQGSTQPDSSSEEDQEESEGRNREVRRVFSRLSMIRRIGGKRHTNIRRTKSRYTVNVTIKEKKTPVFCDTGADICIMSETTARKLKLDVLPTAMVIRPYGSKSQRCKGETCCTVMFNESVANAKFYILDAKVETLISGAVSEELGIIKVNPTETSNKTNKTLEEESSDLVQISIHIQRNRHAEGPQGEVLHRRRSSTVLPTSSPNPIPP